MQIVTAGTKLRHYKNEYTGKTICGKDIVSICEDQSETLPTSNSYGDELVDLQLAVQCRKCESRNHADRGLVQRRNMENYKIRVSRGTIVPL